VQLRTNTFDLWIFHKCEGDPRYLLFRTSQEKADEWFNGHRFWQTAPGGMIREDETIEDAFARILRELGLASRSVWAAEYTYTIWNLKRANLEMVPVFAAEVEEPKDVPLGPGLSDFGWFTARECEERLLFRGLKEGLRYVREYVSEVAAPAGSLRVT
jgi:ADP-ribose pyrophosphatase YjhB (NUDIX family)